jgi:hypothetical protein
MEATAKRPTVKIEIAMSISRRVKPLSFVLMSAAGF